MKLLDKIMKSANSRKIEAKTKARNFRQGGFRERNTQAIYFPRQRGKIKGYMKTA